MINIKTCHSVYWQAVLPDNHQTLPQTVPTGIPHRMTGSTRKPVVMFC